MRLTFGDAKRALSQWAGRGGKCPDNEDVYNFTYEVLQHLLFTGAHGNERKFCFQAVKGCFTVPFELEAPLKIKIDGCVGTVWNKWFEWYGTRESPGYSPCIVPGRFLFEDPNEYATAYEIAACGSRVGALGICLEAPDAHIIVQGEDSQGKEVFTYHKGNQIVGEYLSVVKGELRFSTTIFRRITGIIKTKTNGYVQLLAVNPEKQSKTFLSEYSPLEEKPSYRRFRLTGPCGGPVTRVSLIGRIRLKEAYADMDFIPFENRYALQLAAQEINADYNNDSATAAAKNQKLEKIIENENSYKRIQNGSPIEVDFSLSMGAVRNIVS